MLPSRPEYLDTSQSELYRGTRIAGPTNQLPEIRWMHVKKETYSTSSRASFVHVCPNAYRIVSTRWLLVVLVQLPAKLTKSPLAQKVLLC